MATESLTATSFEGLKRGSRSMIRSDRQGLDVPRELLNLHVTENGDLWMPPASHEIIASYTSDHGPIISMTRTDIPRGLWVQTAKGLFFYDTYSIADEDFPSEKEVLTESDIDETGWAFWYNDLRIDGQNSPVYFGYAPRGVGSADGQTWKAYYNEDFTDLVVEELDNEVTPWASDSVMYKGRRYITQRAQRVFYSALNQPEEFPEDNSFELGGDDSGTDWQEARGFVQGIIPFEDYLIFMLTSSIWVLGGADPESGTLREAESTIGGAQFSFARVPQGICYYGGENVGDPGIYFFSGNNSRKISGDLDEFLRHTGSIGGAAHQSSRRQKGTFFGGRYVWTIPRNQFGRQVYIYNFDTRAWTTFGGYGDEGPVVALNDNAGVVIADGSEVRRHQTTSAMEVWPRKPGESAKLTLGWHDDDNPTGWVRFLAVKVSGWKSGTGTPKLALTARTPDGSLSEQELDITDDVFDALVFPLGIRGNSVELDFEIRPTDDSQQVLIESVQLVHSRKGEKVSRR